MEFRAVELPNALSDSVGRNRLNSAFVAACGLGANHYNLFSFVKMESNFDVRKFISLIKTKVSIWNYKSTAYANKAQRREDWLSVCEDMVPDFGDKTSEEKNDLVLQYQTKWRVLRDGFTRSVKNYNEKLESGAKRKLYLYYEHLHFLHDLYIEKVMATQNNSGTCPRHRNSKCKKRRRMNTGESTDDLDNEKSKQRSTTSDSNDDSIEEDKQFLLSLLSDFRKIPEDQKLDAKGDIINVIRHYRNATIQFETRGSYYANDITALATTATDGYYEQAILDECSGGSSSPIEIKFTN